MLQCRITSTCNAMYYTGNMFQYILVVHGIDYARPVTVRLTIERTRRILQKSTFMLFDGRNSSKIKNVPVLQKRLFGQLTILAHSFPEENNSKK